MNILNKVKSLSVVFACLAIVGCATQVTETPTTAIKAKQPLSNYPVILLSNAVIKAPYAGQGANEKAVKKVNEVMLQRLQGLFENVQRTTDANANTSNALLIKPLVKQVKFIGGGARFFAGAAAGSSVIVMDVEFIDANTGDVVARTGTYRKANAYAGSWTIGAADNQMLKDAAQDIVDFARANY